MCCQMFILAFVFLLMTFFVVSTRGREARKSDENISNMLILIK